MSAYKELKERSWQCTMELPTRNLVLYTFGNVSFIDRDKGVIAIKPSGVPYEELKPDQMVVVDLDNKIVEGMLRFSSDTKTHTLLYRHFPEIGGVVHTHAPYSVAWAQAKKAIPVFGTTHADYVAGEVPCTEVMSDKKIKGDYEEETGNLILERFKGLSYKEVEMALVACHGPFTWGKSPEEAVHNMVILEELAKIALLTITIDPGASPLKQELIEKHYQRKHGKNAYYGQK
ncbi:MAG: L-ribulose-5-phosphate 4-epimerase [Chitinivibrionales bacterium]